ncbi:uncharacterized protein [Amphiura filiformis]|uniref:uncharacterized protein n=1 Tax=Amphiura filiformis TaxID=82378 RepID=UPI003B2171F8
MGDLKTAIAKVDDLAQSLGRGLTDVLLAFDSTNAAKKQQTRELLTKMREEVPVQLHQATAVIKAKTKQHHVPIPTQFSYGASPIIYCTPPTTPDNKASMPVSPNTTAKDKPVPKGAKKAALPAAVSRPKKPTLPAAAAAPKKPTLPAAPAPKKPTPAPAAAKVAPPPQTPSKKPRRTKSKRKLPKKETKVTILDEMAKAGFGDMAGNYVT